MSTLPDVATVVLLALGAVATLTAALGLIRLPEFFSRTHALGVLDTLGAGMILLAFGLQTGFDLETFKLALVLAFILITGPTAAHALARSALRTGVEPRTGAEEDPPSER